MNRVSKKLIVALGLFIFSAAQVNAQCCCLCGKKVCHLEVSKETEDVTVFEVKPKEICIPGIKLPWECKRRCGGVRTICTLSEAKEEKTVCKYDWSIKTICTGCCKKHGLKRGARSCDICKDEKVPFDYYALDAETTKPVAGKQIVRMGTSLQPAQSKQPASEQAVANPAAVSPASAAEPVNAERATAEAAKSETPSSGFRIRTATTDLWKKLTR